MNKHPYKIGRPRIYATPEDFAVAADAYLLWVHENPLFETKAIVTANGGDGGSDVGKYEVNKPRVMSIGAFCIHACISNDSFYEYAKMAEFSDVTKALGETFAAQQLEGASAGLFNPNIIARKLGLADATKTDATQSIRIENAGGKDISDLLRADD